MCWSCLWQQMCVISWDLLAPVQYNHQYILGWPPLRITEKGSSETQELKLIYQLFSKEITRVKPEYIWIYHPPPPAINSFASSLLISTYHYIPRFAVNSFPGTDLDQCVKLMPLVCKFMFIHACDQPIYLDS